MLWARLAALIMRLTQALFDPEDVNLMCYVDDPIAVLRVLKNKGLYSSQRWSWYGKPWASGSFMRKAG